MIRNVIHEHPIHKKYLPSHPQLNIICLNAKNNSNEKLFHFSPDNNRKIFIFPRLAVVAAKIGVKDEEEEKEFYSISLHFMKIMMLETSNIQRREKN